MAEFYSYQKWLTKLKDYDFKLIIEWGTGESTKQMAKQWPNAKIHSIEHDYKFYKRWLQHIQYKNVSIHHHYLDLDYTIAPFYYVDPESVDFCFIDGRRRVECMFIAKIILKTNGFLLLHDAERQKYKRGIEIFKKIMGDEGTLIAQK